MSECVSVVTCVECRGVDVVKADEEKEEKEEEESESHAATPTTDWDSVVCVVLLSCVGLLTGQCDMSILGNYNIAWRYLSIIYVDFKRV